MLQVMSQLQFPSYDSKIILLLVTTSNHTSILDRYQKSQKKIQKIFKKNDGSLFKLDEKKKKIFQKFWGSAHRCDVFSKNQQ